MSGQLSISRIGNAIAGILQTYHVALYSLTIVIGVSAAIFFLSTLVTLSATTGSTEQKSYPIDKTVIKQIDEYQSRHEASASRPQTSNERINPFAE